MADEMVFIQLCILAGFEEEGLNWVDGAIGAPFPALFRETILTQFLHFPEQAAAAFRWKGRDSRDSSDRLRDKPRLWT